MNASQQYPVSGLPRQSGTALIYTLIGLVVLLGLCSLAVDIGYIKLVRAELRSALDSAALAGASALSVSPAEARARAKAVAAANQVNGKPLTLLDSDIELGSWNADTRQFTKLIGANETSATAMRVTARLQTSRGTQVGLFFARLFGRDSLDMQVSSTSGYGIGVDVVIVQDVTHSFSTELADAKKADQALLDSLYARGGTGAMGIVAFGGWGKTIAPLQTIKTNYTALTNKITSLKLAGNPGMPAQGGTDIATGLSEAITVFNSYATPSNSGKAIVLVGDGEPNASSSGAHPTYSNAQLLTLAQQVADQAWAQQIHVYVVFYNETNSLTAANQLRSLIRGEGKFIQVTNASDLPAAMGNISRSIRLQLCD